MTQPDAVQAEILARLDRLESRDEIRQLILKYSLALDCATWTRWSISSPPMSPWVAD